LDDAVDLVVHHVFRFEFCDLLEHGLQSE